MLGHRTRPSPRPRWPGTSVQLRPDLGPDDVARLVGRGDGLTPLGDDVLCGWLAIHRAAGVETPEVDAAVRAHRDRTTLLSATLLDCALARRGAPRVRGVRRRARHPRRAGRGDRPGAVGHTSGAGLLYGAQLALTHLQETPMTSATSHDEPRGAPARRVRRLGHAAPGQPDRAGPGRRPRRPGRDGDPAQRRRAHRDGLRRPRRGRTERHGRRAARSTTPDALAGALAGVEQALRDANRRESGPAELAPPRTTGSGVRRTPDAIVLVSVPGANAFVEAMDAVDAGRDVMVFSDNVPLDQEIALKRAAAERGVLVMGPDCGTAVVGGLGLGFANAVSPGPVGIVAASGTGCQQLLALLDHAGVGVTSALGVGGRDLSAEVRGLATREALRRLDADPAVELIVLVSKPPADDVAAEIEEYADGLATPVEFALLGPGRPDLTAAAEAVLRRLGREVPTWPVTGSTSPGAGLVRGLFVGGTLASEAMLIAGGARTRSSTSATTPTPPAGRTR